MNLVSRRLTRLALVGTPLKVVALFLLMLAFPGSVNVLVQSSPPANARHFQMALFTYEGMSGVDWSYTTNYVDIPMFGSAHPWVQPPGRSIMELNGWYNDNLYSNGLQSSVPVDWSRILAVLIDEPYTNRLQEEDQDYSADNPCHNATRKARIDEIRVKLMRAVDAVHDVAARARVWVNFSIHEVRWMRDAECPQPLLLNDPAIDVVSLDKYEEPFSAIQGHYDWFVSAWPQQQLALVPGTYFVAGDGGISNFTAARAAAFILQGYFNYANSMNQHCDVGLGRVGRTGSYDGCRVWIVAGWSAQPTYQNYRGILHPESDRIATAWLDQFAKIRRLGGRPLSGGELDVLFQRLED